MVFNNNKQKIVTLIAFLIGVAGALGIFMTDQKEGSANPPVSIIPHEEGK